MISSLVSIAVTSCSTVEYRMPVIPAYDVPLPVPDRLVEIPEDDPEFALVLNMTYLDAYSRKLEAYIENMRAYYMKVSGIVFD